MTVVGKAWFDEALERLGWVGVEEEKEEARVWRHSILYMLGALVRHIKYVTIVFSHCMHVIMSHIWVVIASVRSTLFFIWLVARIWVYWSGYLTSLAGLLGLLFAWLCLSFVYNYGTKMTFYLFQLTLGLWATFHSLIKLSCWDPLMCFQKLRSNSKSLWHYLCIPYPGSYMYMYEYFCFTIWVFGSDT